MSQFRLASSLIALLASSKAVRSLPVSGYSYNYGDNNYDNGNSLESVSIDTTIIGAAFDFTDVRSLGWWSVPFYPENEIGQHESSFNFQPSFNQDGFDNYDNSYQSENFFDNANTLDLFGTSTSDFLFPTATFENQILPTFAFNNNNFSNFDGQFFNQSQQQCYAFDQDNRFNDNYFNILTQQQLLVIVKEVRIMLNFKYGYDDDDYRRDFDDFFNRYDDDDLRRIQDYKNWRDNNRNNNYDSDRNDRFRNNDYDNSDRNDRFRNNDYDDSYRNSHDFEFDTKSVDFNLIHGLDTSSAFEGFVFDHFSTDDNSYTTAYDY